MLDVSLSHDIIVDDAERLGLLRAIPLVIMMAVADNADTSQDRSKSADSDSEEEDDDDDDDEEEDDDEDDDDEEEDIADPLDFMPKHFDKEEPFFPAAPVSRSNSSASVELDSSSFIDPRPTSACTDTSETSMNASFDQTPASEIDESSFDSATLTCKICKKVLKNLRTFKNHKARHFGTLNHKCPDCNKCFEGRSAVNRHLISNHNRELQPHEITTNPAAAGGINIIKPAAPEIKLFKPSEMAKKSFKPSEVAAKPGNAPKTEVLTSSGGHLTSSETPPVLEHLSGKPPGSEDGAGPSSSAGQMPILLENQETEIRYIVGSQLKPGDAVLPAQLDKWPEEEEEEDKKMPDLDDFSQPLSTSSPRKSECSDENLDDDIPNLEEIDDAEDKSSSVSKLPQKLAHFERIIPESDDSDSDKSDSDTSSSSDPQSSDSDSDESYSDKKESASKKKPEEITIDDDEEEDRRVLNKSDSKQYHQAFESFLSKSKDDSESDVEEDPLENKRKTRQASKRSQQKSSKVVTCEPDDDITVFDPHEEARQQKETKEKQIKSICNQKVSLSDDDSSNDEAAEERSKKPQKKVSMVAAIFRAKQKKQTETETVPAARQSKKLKNIAARVLLPKGQKKVEATESESEREREKEKERAEGASNSSNAPLDKEAQDEADKLLEQKGVAVVGGKLMIPADRLKIPEELCKIKTLSKGRASKKMFICEICDKQFNRADKMKYHLYNEHYDDFIRCSDSVPKILAKNYSTPKAEAKLVEKEKSVISKPSALARIFAQKNKKAQKPKQDVEDSSKHSSSLFDLEEDNPDDIKSPKPEAENSRAKPEDEEDSLEEEERSERTVRRSSRSPRGRKVEAEDEIASSESLVREKAILAAPSMKLSNIPFLSKPQFPSQEPSYSLSLTESSKESGEVKSPFASKHIPILQREETGINMMSGASTFEPKFGADKDLVTFADLAMKSKEQKTNQLSPKPRGRPGRPKKVGRKKISARISVEQSNIEDTPSLKAMQAAKEIEEAEKIDLDEAEVDPEKPKNLLGDIKVDSDVDDQKTHNPSTTEETEASSQDEANRKEEESRPTRSKLHVDTIGLSSSTLDLELHALRNLVFKEILESTPEEISLPTEDQEEEEEMEGSTENIADVKTEEQPSNTPAPDNQLEDKADLSFEEISDHERFNIIGEKFIEMSKQFATAIWHERKRLRLRKRKELIGILDKVPVERRGKFKPKRHDFSLQLLCSNNLYNNILVDAENILSEMKSVHFLAGHCSGFVSRKKQMFTKSKLHESKISLKRLKRNKYSAKQNGEMKILLSQIREEQPEVAFDDDDLISNPDEFVSMMSPDPVKTDLNIKASDFRSRGKQKKVPTPPKKFKVNKVTWGSPVFVLLLEFVVKYLCRYFLPIELFLKNEC